MWLLRLVGILDVLIGVLTFIMPVRIYDLLYLPALLLVLNGAALLSLGFEPAEEGETAKPVPPGRKTRPPAPQRSVARPAPPTPPPVKVVTRTSGGAERAPPGKGREMVGKDVYDQLGRYHGKVQSVSLDEKGNLKTFKVVKGETEITVSGRDLESNKGIVLLRYGRR